MRRVVNKTAEQVNSERFEDVLQSENAVLADFYSESCVPCKRMSPVFSEIESEHEGRIKAVKINVAENRGAAEKYGVHSVPTFILFKNGGEISRVIGAVPKSQLTDLIEKIQ